MSQSEASSGESNHEKEVNLDSILEDQWMIRDCEIYKDEYKECTSFKGRFHQYFIYGHTIDCIQWKKDNDNCCKWVDNKDTKAAKSLIESEKKRRMERLQAHFRNDTWKKRKSPPTDWDKPLPEWMSKRYENTYLEMKAKEMKEGKDEDTVNSFCAIM
ncbi:unnamed protein product [Chilo suppressalis]|uniref:Synaptic plasticity regulator PANTS n=1 Tax=Chilo suppressalis TaxID=168631 RepID=A0ABN8LC81_CHISP|nr:unnamed protein product [Chilo suppressalis]